MSLRSSHRCFLLLVLFVCFCCGCVCVPEFMSLFEFCLWRFGHQHSERRPLLLVSTNVHVMVYVATDDTNKNDFLEGISTGAITWFCTPQPTNQITGTKIFDLHSRTGLTRSKKLKEREKWNLKFGILSTQVSIWFWTSVLCATVPQLELMWVSWNEISWVVQNIDRILLPPSRNIPYEFSHCDNSNGPKKINEGGNRTNPYNNCIKRYDSKGEFCLQFFCGIT